VSDYWHKERGFKRQQGAAAIEFSFVFALLFGMFWAIISYAMPFFLYQTMSYAAADAARYALRAAQESDLEAPNLKALSKSNAELTLKKFLPTAFESKLNVSSSVKIISIPTSSGRSIDLRELVIIIDYPNYNSNPLLPQLNLPGVGRIPNIPDDFLHVEASVRMK
jgi:hypothetical protein